MELSNKQVEALTFVKSEETSLLAEGKIRSGKSFIQAMGFFYYTQCLEESKVHLITGYNRPMLMTEIVPHLKRLSQAYRLSWRGSWDRGSVSIADQEYVVAAGFDQESEDRISGLTIHSVLGEEVTRMPESFLGTVFSRMSFGDSKAFLSCNPANKRHWLKTKWIDEGLIDRVMHFSFEDNPTLEDKVVERYKSMYTGVFRARYIEGEWADAEGLIYPNYQTYEGPEFEPTYSVVGVDYGITDPTVFIKIALIPKKKMFVITECEYITEPVPDSVLRDKLYTFVQTGKVRSVYLPDDAASLKAELRRRAIGVSVRKANMKVVPGIRTVSSKFEDGTLLMGQDPSLEIVKQELDGYQWNAKLIDTPKKQDDHSPDAIRYAAFTGLSHVGGERVGWR